MPNKMKLLALTHSLSDIDGVGKYAVSVLREVRRFCDPIEVLLGRKHRGISTDLPAGIGVHPVLPPDYFMYMSRIRFFYFLLSRLPRIFAAARRADLIHCLCDYPFALLAWLAGRAAGKPVIVSGHGTYSVAPFRYPLHRTLIRKSYGGVDAVIFGSDFARGKFEERLRLPNVGVVDYGVDVSAYLGEKPPPPAGVKPPYVLGIGELKERKGHEISMRSFVGAARKYPNLTYALVGNYLPEDPYYQGLVRLLEREGLLGRVRFLGNVSEEEKRALYAHSEAFILTPKEGSDGSFEALGLVYLEAGASGVPVIGTYDSGAVCAIEQGKNGYLISPDKPEEGAEAIAAILEDSDLKRCMGDAGRIMAQQRNWARVGEKLERIYGNIIGRRAPFER
ncbi:MAG: glycosyltransferase family 4 protein [Planctomycetes bacterium]|nr:glycosyltransferase family 4 protein [Planctomycetota bacterium]